MNIFRTKIRWTTVLFYALVLLVMVLAVRHLADVERAALYLEELNPYWLLAALAAQALTYYFVAHVFNALIRFYGHRKLGHWTLYRSAMVIVFLDQTIPTGGVSGNSFIYSRLRRAGLPAGEAFSVVILKALTYYLSHLTVLLLGLLVYLDLFAGEARTAVPAVAVVGVVAYVALLGLIMYFGEPKTLFKLRQRLSRWRLGGLLSRLGFTEHGATPHDWHGPVRLMRENPRLMLRILALQIGVIMADVFTCYALYAGLGRQEPFSVIAICFSLTMIVSLLSVTPGALAFFEAAMILFYASFGINVQLAAIVTLLFRALSFWLPMPVGLAFYRQLTRSPKAVSAAQ